jgi:hypothetical protein
MMEPLQLALQSRPVLVRELVLELELQLLREPQAQLVQQERMLHQQLLQVRLRLERRYLLRQQSSGALRLPVMESRYQLCLSRLLEVVHRGQLDHLQL